MQQVREMRLLHFVPLPSRIFNATPVTRFVTNEGVCDLSPLLRVVVMACPPNGHLSLLVAPQPKCSYTFFRKIYLENIIFSNPNLISKPWIAKTMIIAAQCELGPIIATENSSYRLAYA